MFHFDAIRKAGVSLIAAAGLGLAVTGGAQAAAVIDQTAPDFTGTDSNGETFTLSDYRNQTVILEWTNHDCPYVKKHYDTDNMQALQRQAAEDDIVWVTLISSAPGKQGHVSGEKANELTESRNASPSRVILDESGEIGRMYDARTTPHMYVIDGEGVLRYMGAIDDKPDTKKASVETATNYVTQALAELASGETVSEPQTTAYGCSVKY